MDHSDKICRLLVETTRSGIWMINENAIISFVNKRMADMLGYPVGEIIGKPIYDFMESEMKKQAEELLSKSRIETFKQQEFKLQKKNGEPFWLQFESSPFIENGKYKGTLAIISDISELKNSQSQVVAHEQQLNLIFNNAIDAMWLIGVEPGEKYRFESINQSYERITGFTYKGIVGKCIDEVLPQSSIKLARIYYAQAIQKQKQVDYTVTSTFPAGERVAEVRVIPVKNKDHNITKLVCIANDITARAIAEDQNNLLQMELTKAIINTQEQERTQIGLELHDNVNQILAGALLNLGMIREVGLERSPEFVNRAKENINNAIKEIRTLSHRLAPVSMDAISFKEAVEDLIKSMNIQDTYKINLVFTDFDFEDYSGLKINLYRILQEQLNNIVKYAEASVIEIFFSQMNNSIRLRIYDNGKGFDTQADTKGIGINNIRMRTETFGGRFLLNSYPGKGCEMIIEIPISNT